jgi:DNA-binding SARP family transcriptional activator
VSKSDKTAKKASAKGANREGGQLRVHGFGSLEISWDGAAVEGFESQKVRALLLYLACNRDRPLTRDHLAATFWPDKDEDAARRNLRQSLYNLKSLFPQGLELVHATRQHVQISPDIDCWVDSSAFEEAVSSSGEGERLDPHRLTEAVGLYRGNFLTGFQIRDSEEFEYWLAQEQERLRELAVSALRLLIDSYLDRGEYRLGIQYAQRLVAIDPLSEDAHQRLMQLYALSGRRSRALAQYDELTRVLQRELDVEPLEETSELHERILKQGSTLPYIEATGEALGPVIPMAGRREEYERLRLCMQSALGGDGLVTVIEGKAGVGKTRLIRSFLDAASSKADMIVLKGSSLDVLPESYQPLTRALRGAFAPTSEPVEEAVALLGEPALRALANLVPELASGLPLRDDDEHVEPAAARERLFTAIAELFVGLCGLPGSQVRTIVVLLDDLQRADPATVELLRALDSQLRAFPIWIVAACTRERLPAEHPLHEFVERDVAPDHRVQLGHLDEEAIEEIAAALVAQGQAPELSDFLLRNSDGLPHLLSECINYLRDSGYLHPEAGRWALARSLADLQVQMGDLRAVIVSRYQHLPHSTRRLAALAAVAGSRFQGELIAAAGQEHPAVCQIAFDVMLQRWLLRRSSDQWQRRQSTDDANGPRPDENLFEFASETIWRTIYDQIKPSRRRLMHGELARALENAHADDPGAAAELLAHHFRAAGIHLDAAQHLEAAAHKAQSCGATETAVLYLQLAAEELSAQQSKKGADEASLSDRIDRLAERRAELEAVPVRA